MKKIIILVAGVLVLLGGGGAGIYFLKPDLLPDFIRPKSAAAGKDGNKHEEAHKAEPEVGADLDVFVVNLAGPGPSRYLRTILSLAVKNEHDKEKIKELSGKIRHNVIMYLTERKAEELIDPEGKNRVRQELQKQINAAVGDNKFVSNVYFKEFLIQ
ncbi:MAG TPA: flagellar basal body-associated FliL family protein [Terriglobales bacterium]|nr:flagellar basal body-associated FliL family protein [Terriglobales bacterium]